MVNQKRPPKYLNLLRISMPVGALASIAHRLSGVLMFLAIPLLIYLLDSSLQSPDGFEHVRDSLNSPMLKIISLILVWALSHHLLAGMRFLLLDLHIGLDLATARAGAWAVNLGGLAIALAYGICLI